MDGSSDTRCLVDLTPEERDILVALVAGHFIEDTFASDETVKLLRAKLEGAPEVTEPWHMMGTRADGAAVGRGMGPIGGCGQSRDCTPPTLEQVRDGPPDGSRPHAIPKGPLGPVLDADPFEREGKPTDKITAYGVLDLKTGTAAWYGDGEPPDWFTNRANDAFREARMVPYPKYEDDYGDPFSSLQDAKRATDELGDTVDDGDWD